ncbi:MAG: 4-(cytidine 5'-diphospho)-2-C-methyl-D-erythritol kinase [candidate division KSB1 bacterium]|nr:4-(cytidine 5'-diphospho)-2-C-methyl-D-erythritol kinase [candidate division KSB1 bacterium]
MYNSNAKINLGLSVLNKRKDGFHNIETFFQEISLCDKIEITPAESGIQIQSDHKDCPGDERNLAHQAAAALQQTGCQGKGCIIKLSKQIPIGAGLGGGSSNAATVLGALNQKWECRQSRTRLTDIAASLGSDVPFFMSGGLAFGTGRGETLTPLLFKPVYRGLLIIPPFSISTREIYENLSLTNKRKITKLKGFIDNFYRLDPWKETLENDLQTVVLKKYPDLQDIINKLYASGAFFAQMSGSGSAFYGLFKSEDKLRECSQYFAGGFRKLLFEPIYK